MSMTERYYTEFISQKGDVWGLKILQEDGGTAWIPKEVTLPGDGALQIEWPEVDKMEPVFSSNATLVLNSDDDREFIDLYNIAAGSVRLDVYKGGLDGTLYWSGTMDPEIYEEPFSYYNNYDVSLTFSDFAILDRLNYDLNGIQTVRTLITTALSRSGINSNIASAITEFISTTVPSVTTQHGLLDDLSLQSGNFYDEDDKPSTWREVLDECLRILSLHLQQKDGKVVIFDLNSIYTAVIRETVEWDDQDAVVGVDKVYNNIKLTFSPYTHHKLIEANVDVDTIGTALTTTRVNVDDSDSKVPGFDFITSDVGEGVTKNGGKFFKIVPIYSGNKEAGVAWRVQIKVGTPTNTYTEILQGSLTTANNYVVKSDKLPFIAYTGNSDKYRLCAKLEMLSDVRYNPFEQTGVNNEKGNWDRMQKWCQFVYVPFRLILHAIDGNVYHYVNSSCRTLHTYNITRNWESGEGDFTNAYLCYYDASDRSSKSGIGGWTTNRHAIGDWSVLLPQIFSSLPEGEFIPLPPVAGNIEMQIGKGIVCNYNLFNDSTNDFDAIAHWLLYKSFSLTLVDSDGNSIESQDNEINAYINKAAQESLTVKTIIGSLSTPSPTAMGQLFTADGTSVVTNLMRNGKSDIPQQLLIATAYSQYATRHNTLSGTAVLIDKFTTLTDDSQPGYYMLLSEIQDLQAGTSEIKMCEFEADHYERSAT